MRTPKVDITIPALEIPKPPSEAVRAPSTSPPLPGSTWAAALASWCRTAVHWFVSAMTVGDRCPCCGAPSDRFASVVSTPYQPGDPTVAMRCGICDTEWRSVAVWPPCEF